MIHHFSLGDMPVKYPGCKNARNQVAIAGTKSGCKMKEKKCATAFKIRGNLTSYCKDG